jgi:hypothetical protein
MNVRYNKNIANQIYIQAGILLFLSFWGCAPRFTYQYQSFPKPSGQWYALHLLNHTTDADLQLLGTYLDDLERIGINTLILEVDYSFSFQSHPELRQGNTPITKPAAQKLAKNCREHGIRLIPEFQCFGHQSWAGQTFPLLTIYPEFDLTPGAFPGNEGLYCREWNPLDPKLKQIVFDLMDELIEAFSADAFHVGMDEIFLIKNEYARATNQLDPAVVLAKAIKDYHEHLVRNRGVEMLMWGDRLIDCLKYPYGEWEASCNGTAAAVDLIPKDIIICDWHYEKMEAYPSIPMFLEKGFRVLPASWRNVDASQNLIRYSIQQNNVGMLGHLYTVWGGRIDKLINYPPMVEGMNYFWKYETAKLNQDQVFKSSWSPEIRNGSLACPAE